MSNTDLPNNWLCFAENEYENVSKISDLFPPVILVFWYNVFISFVCKTDWIIYSGSSDMDANKIFMVDMLMHLK